MKNIIFKISKFISSRLLYLMIGIFLAIGATYVYATWDQAKTGGSGELGQSNWNALITEIHNKCGTNCDAIAAAATTANNILTESNWNSLADLLNSTLTDCATDDSGKCFINQASKSVLDTDLAAGNIKSGVTIFGVSGNANCTVLKPNGSTCALGTECISGYCYIDADNDRYAPTSGTKKCKASSQLSGVDCYDSNPDVHPGQTTFFSYNRGDGSFDYDCDGNIDQNTNTCVSCSGDCIPGMDSPCVTGGLCTGDNYNSVRCSIAQMQCGQTFQKYFCSAIVHYSVTGYQQCENSEYREGIYITTPCEAYPGHFGSITNYNKISKGAENCSCR